MECSVAYLSNGTIRLLKAGANPVPYSSPFAEAIKEKDMKSKQRHAWKSEGGSEKMIPSASLWGAGNQEAVRLFTTSLCRGPNQGSFLFTLETDHMCAILSVENAGTQEQRLWNNNLKRVRYLHVHPTQGAIATAVEHAKLGTANIGVRLPDDSGWTEITEGDSVDTAPRWIPSDGLEMVYQSAGVGRSREGHIGALGPYAVYRLNANTGEMDLLLENARFDYLTPAMDGAGNLYYIKRPYVSGLEMNPLTMAKDVVLFPFRLGRAFLGFLNIFSMMYSGKKLTSARSHGTKPVDLPQMIIWGNLIKAQQTGSSENNDLIPKSWQLIRRDPQGREEVIENGVLCFDLTPSGDLAYSNGSRIWFRSGNEKKLVGSDNLVQQVAILTSPAL